MMTTSCWQVVERPQASFAVSANSVLLYQPPDHASDSVFVNWMSALAGSQ